MYKLQIAFENIFLKIKLSFLSLLPAPGVWVKEVAQMWEEDMSSAYLAEMLGHAPWPHHMTNDAKSNPQKGSWWNQSASLGNWGKICLMLLDSPWWLCIFLFLSFFIYLREEFPTVCSVTKYSQIQCQCLTPFTISPALIAIFSHKQLGFVIVTKLFMI